MSRASFLSVLVFLAGAAILCRLFLIQVVRHDYYAALARGQQKFFREVPTQRGEISFRDEREVLASNRLSDFVFASPREIPEKERGKTIDLLAELLGLEKSSLLEKLNRDTYYEPLKKDISPEDASRLNRLNLQGIYLGQELIRFYPQTELASRTLGFVDLNHQGQYGLEGFYEPQLRGKKGRVEEEKGSGLTIFSNVKEAPAKGQDLVLTLDYQIQSTAERLLQKAGKELEFETGTIIVVDPTSGEILTLAVVPGFNPNHYEKERDLRIFQNPASQWLFEPGSVFKPLTMAAAIEEGKITPQTKYIDEGVVKVGQTPIYNYDNRKYGERTMTEVLEKSINTGAVFAQKRLGSELFLEYLGKFGFFEKTGVDLQAEVFSQNLAFKKGYEINFATASFGQGIEITPLQLVRAFSAIANNGRLLRPHLVKTAAEENPKTVISSQTASQVASMMTSVIEQGFSQKAKIPGYYLAGKTGTAQVAWPALGINKPGYSDKTIQSFIGFGPVLDPKFLILVKLDNPKTRTAEYSATPIFRDLAKYIIDLWQIPPDYE